MRRPFGSCSALLVLLSTPVLAQEPLVIPQTHEGTTTQASPASPTPTTEDEAAPSAQVTRVAAENKPKAVGLPRAEHRVALLGELGWNSLAGLGLNLAIHAHPQVSLDFGLGLAATGLKAGARARYNFLRGEWTPLLGAGLLYGSGTGGREVELDTDGNVVTFEIEPSPFLQAVAGVEYTPEDGGLTFLATAGYAHLFGENLVLVSGTPTEVQRDAMDLAYHGGVVISVALGYAF